MRRFLKYLLAKIGYNPNSRFNEGWDNLSIIITILDLAIKVVRGYWLKLFLKKSDGLVLVGKKTKVLNSRFISAGKNFTIDDYAEINGLSQDEIQLGDNVTIGKFALVRPTNFYGRKIGEGLIVGDNSNIGPWCYLGCSGKIDIGDNVMMSPRVSIYAENHIFDKIDVPMKDQGIERLGVTIEDDCWIASNSIILAGVTIGKGSVVAAGSIVTKDIPSYSIAAGNPAKIISKRK